MIDNSPSMIKDKAEKFRFDLWQLRTPLTQYRLSGRQYGLDNGCFKRFDSNAWNRLLGEAIQSPPVFVTLPDIVGDARRTLELFDIFHKQLHPKHKRALVLQDGIGQHNIPWNDLQAVFIGGSDDFKISTEAVNAAKTARILGKWVHVGRVNTVERVNNWIGLGDSIDGSGISKYDHMLESVIDAIANKSKQTSFFETGSAGAGV